MLLARRSAALTPAPTGEQGVGSPDHRAKNSRTLGGGTQTNLSNVPQTAVKHTEVCAEILVFPWIYKLVEATLHLANETGFTINRTSHKRVNASQHET